ncbi:MAG: DUF1328 family protein [Burkholderiales bacterium]
MIDWPMLYLIVTLVAGLLGLTGVPGAATEITWIVFVIGLVLFFVSMKAKDRPPRD